MNAPVQRSQHTASYYAASSLPQPDHPVLQGELVADVCVVGGGFSGLNTALELAERYQVEMPIVQTVNAIVNKGMSAAEAVKSLMERGLKNELPQGYEK